MSIRIADVCADSGIRGHTLTALRDCNDLNIHGQDLGLYPFRHWPITDDLLAIDKRLAEPLPYGFFDAVVLCPLDREELDAGLELIAAVSHCLPAVFVLFSQYIKDSHIRKQARQLGVRFATNNSNQLGQLVNAADHVCRIRRQAITPLLRYLPQPISATGPNNLADLMFKSYELGRAFNGDGYDFRKWNDKAIAVTELAKSWLDREKRPDYIGPLACIHEQAHLCLRLVEPYVWA